MTAVRVLDFGMGNLRSVAKALERAGGQVSVAPELDPDADLLVVPGQGAFGSCVVNLGERLKEIAGWIEDGRAYFGICLGLQILFDGSEEEPAAAGVGVLPGVVRALPRDVKIPHIGWNDVVASPSATLFDEIDPRARFYFVHSFYADPVDPDDVAATTEYGVAFCSAVERGNMWATQFHPEKSGDVGLALLGTVVRAFAR